jgi:glycosyltransferase involved in cell wall biosynthesis
MRIGLVTPSWPGNSTANGIATAVTHLAAGLRDIGHEITVIPLTQTSDENPGVINLPHARDWSLFEKLSRRLGFDIATVRIRAEQVTGAVLQAIRTRGIEVLIMEETQGIAGAIQLKVPIPVILTLHGPHELHIHLHPAERDTYYTRQRIKREFKAFHGCAGVTAPSQDVLDRTISIYGRPPGPTAVIANPIHSLQPLGAEAIRTRIRNILFIGRYDLHKGGDTVIAAFRTIASQDDEARLTLVGPDRGIARPDGTMQHIDEALDALPDGIRSRIDYRGQMDKNDIELLRYSHGMAMIGSRYETFGYTALEALSCGMPTVATAVGGIPEIIRDMKTGLLVRAEAPEALAQACLRLMGDPELAVRLGAQAHQEVLTRYAPERIARETEAFIQEVHEHRTATRANSNNR